jgi:type II secretory pathway pseudopilin PulG
MKNANFDKRQAGFSLIELLIVSVILMFIIGIISGIVTSAQFSYTRQRQRTESLNDATAALDTLTRLIRMAGNNPLNIGGLQAIDPGTADGGVYRTIRIRSDWRGSTMSSMPDGDISDPFEDIKFFVQNNKLMKREPSDASDVEYLDNVLSLQFVYFDTNNALIINPAANSAAITRIEITVITQSPGTPPITFTSSAFVRQR